MIYKDFEGSITMKFGIVLDNWPTKVFQPPSAMSHLEAEVSLRSWETGSTRFRALSDDEWRAWLTA